MCVCVGEGSEPFEVPPWTADHKPQEGPHFSESIQMCVTVDRNNGGKCKGGFLWPHSLSSGIAFLSSPPLQPSNSESLLSRYRPGYLHCACPQVH